MGSGLSTTLPFIRHLCCAVCPGHRPAPWHPVHGHLWTLGTWTRPGHSSSCWHPICGFSFTCQSGPCLFAWALGPPAQAKTGFLSWQWNSRGSRSRFGASLIALWTLCSAWPLPDLSKIPLRLVLHLGKRSLRQIQWALRQEHLWRLLFLAVLVSFSFYLPVCQQLQEAGHQRIEFTEPGRQEIGQQQSGQAEPRAPIVLPRLICPTSSTWSSGPLALVPPGSTSPAVSFSQQWAPWRDQTPFATASLPKPKPRSTWQVLDFQTSPSHSRHGGRRNARRTWRRLARGCTATVRRNGPSRVSALCAGLGSDGTWNSGDQQHFGFCRDDEKRWTFTCPTRIGSPRRSTRDRHACRSVGFGWSSYPTSCASCCFGRRRHCAGARTRSRRDHLNPFGGFQRWSSSLSEVLESVGRPCRHYGLRRFEHILGPTSFRSGVKSNFMGGWHGVIRQASVLLCRRSGASSAQPPCKTRCQAKSSSRWGYSWRKSSQVSRKEEGHSSQLGGVLGSDHSGASSSFQSAARPISEDSGNRSRHCKDFRPCISIETATWQLSYGWVCESLELGRHCEGHASSERFCKPGDSQSVFWPSRDYRDCGGLERGSVRSCEGGACPESSPHCTGESDSLQLRRPTAGHGLFLSLDFKQGLDGQSEAAKRTCCPERGLFHECFAEHVTEDVSLTAGRGRDVSAATEGRYAYPVFGEIWGLRQIKRSGLHHLAGWTLHELPSGGQPPCRQGCPELAVRLSRTISDGWWQDGCGPSPSPSGGPATDPVFGSVSCGRSKSQTFCTDSQPTLGYDSLAVFEGVGCNQQQTGRSNQQPTEQCRSRGNKCDTKRAPPTQEGGRKRSSKSKGGRFSECRGRDIAGNSDEKELEACIDFQTFLASLPRCILRSRTSFSTFLAMSFHTKRCGDSPATAIFPLPIPIVGLFQKQRVPKLNAKKWRKLCLRRALHVLVVALNYIHNGMKMAPLAALGRRPNMAQKAVYQRLQALRSPETFLCLREDQVLNSLQSWLSLSILPTLTQHFSLTIVAPLRHALRSRNLLGESKRSTNSESQSSFHQFSRTDPLMPADWSCLVMARGTCKSTLRASCGCPFRTLLSYYIMMGHEPWVQISNVKIPPNASD